MARRFLAKPPAAAARGESEAVVGEASGKAWERMRLPEGDAGALRGVAVKAVTLSKETARVMRERMRSLREAALMSIGGGRDILFWSGGGWARREKGRKWAGEGSDEDEDENGAREVMRMGRGRWGGRARKLSG